MATVETPKAQLGWQAADFKLPATDGHSYGLTDLLGGRGLVILFICNNCPYVQKQISRIVETASQLQSMGVGVAAISSNDALSYPQDSFENMKAYASEMSFNFPYLYDESQDVARSYGAVCTPDFFGFNAAGQLQYRGRLTSSWSGLDEDADEDLLMAMQEIAASGSTKREQHSSLGCSIKWRQIEGA